MPKRRALLSVWDKTGIVGFGGSLSERGWEVLSTGGTARALSDAGVPVTEIAMVTGHPEMMEGRVKTLHPAVHAGLLARRDNPADMAELAKHAYAPIDLVAVNLYPFEKTVAAPNATLAAAMENVDIGGPALIRAAAKNHQDVWVVVDPGDYDRMLAALDVPGDATAETETSALRRTLAAKVFRTISNYDRAIAEYLEEPVGRAPARPEPDGGLAKQVVLEMQRHAPLRYGENPGQDAAFYTSPHRHEGIAQLEVLHGKPLSYNNILDIDGALLALAPFATGDDPAVCIVKHATPCGMAVRPTLEAAFERARVTDPVSAFGSVVAANRPVDLDTATRIARMFVECVVAPSFEDGALQVLSAKKNVRLLRFPRSDAPGSRGQSSGSATFLARAAGGADRLSFRSVYGGVLFQSFHDPPIDGSEPTGWRIVSARRPSDLERRDLSFAWSCAASVKSNAILLAKDRATVGIGAGQMSRVDSSWLAVRKAQNAGLTKHLTGCALASDAFFPFRDGIDVAAEAGVRAVIQPGGSIRDDEVVKAADEHGIAMIFTGQRLFRH